ncbi:MAG: hypothetical protein B7W95_00290 [Acidimicrobiales bacterium 20-64-4]|nr:MAG: hypothetical protein B7W95_00290 [Acidimicrobiales bacterium 20-64-4]
MASGPRSLYPSSPCSPAHTWRSRGQEQDCISSERPERYLGAATTFEPMDNNEHAQHHQHDDATTAVDPVCGMTVDKATAAAHRTLEGTEFWFCNVSCAESFDADPGRFLVSHP